MSALPKIEFVGGGAKHFYQIDHLSVQERSDVSVRPVVDQEQRDAYFGGLSLIHNTFADAAEEMGFKVARGGEQHLVRELSRTAEHEGKARKVRAEIARVGTAADAALKDATALADTYGRLVAKVRRRVLAPFARAMADRLVAQEGRQAVADAVADACRSLNIKGRKGSEITAHAMADADLNQAGGLVENLTSYLFMAFVEPQAPQHYRDMFRVQGGINIGLEFLQILFYTMRGEARVWDGTAGDYGNTGPGVAQLKLPVVHFRSSSNLDIITAARELLVFGAANLRTKQLTFAHEVMWNRALFGMQRQSPPQLPFYGLRSWPGVTVKSSGLDYATATPMQLYTILKDMVKGPENVSNQAFIPNRIGYTVGFESAIEVPMVIGGVAIGESVKTFFMKNFPGVDLMAMWELANLYATGTDALVSFPSTGDAAPVALVNPTIILPQFTYGFGVRTDAYSSGAGIVWGAPVGAQVTLIDQS